MNMNRAAMVAITAIEFLLFPMTPCLAIAASGITVSKDTVRVWVPDEEFSGDVTALQGGSWQAIGLDALPRSFRKAPVIGAKTVLAAFNSAAGCVNVYTRNGDRLTKRGGVRPYPTCRPAEFQVVDCADGAGLAVRVRPAKGRLHYAVAVSPEGIVEFRPGESRGLTVGGIRTAYGILPSFIGTDFVYDPRQYTGKDHLYVPSMHLYVGLVQGNDCVMVGAWPSGEQVVRLELQGDGDRRTIEGVSIETAGRSFYLAYLESPRIWHAEPLRDTYLEKDTVIAWKRPFAAKWIGRFFIKSEGVHFPFYFRYEKVKMWGRCIRGWFYYPFWFDKEKTCVHFEKKFPPEGEALIYFLERENGTTGVSSPVEVIQNALGKQVAFELLDFDGIREQVLLEHRNAVCAMTRQVEEIFKAGKEVKQKAFIKQRADDVVDFIRMIRERIFQYDRFADEMRAFLRTTRQADPELAVALAPLDKLLNKMQQERVNGMPDVALDEVRQWADRITVLAGEVRKENIKEVEKLAHQCRRVAGAQDSVARNLSILVIRMTEQAARLGIDSPKHSKLAQQIIAKARGVLRHPTWWEPRRCYIPKSDPGIP